MQDFEKLGVFYLGRERKDDGENAPPDEAPLLLYDSKDLVTHGVCLGMTGSGKTGLCIAMLEEAAIDGIPVLAIDPKGDIPNLLLTFPDLATGDFQPWVNAEDARRKGLGVEEYAGQQADFWKDGLAKWGQDGRRIAKLRESADMAIYTPGSTAGIPVSILESFAAPSSEVLEDAELLGDRIGTAVSSLLGLLGIDADPLKSREHILLSAILENAWKAGRDLDLAGLIRALQTPPITKIGVLDLDAFFPPNDRFVLAMTLNNLLASPGFSAWLDGVPLDLQEILYTRTGKPRVAIFYLAHLGENERMFFVSLLLNQVVSWMRAQSGTTSLRALVYMDEVFGYFPPVANPPSKRPLLTLLKQARAYGVGVLLATQNPVDLDYKGLANTGTWFIGRLQTDRDKARVLEALHGATAAGGVAFDRPAIERLLGGLGNRVFVMHNTHEDHPVRFETRWVMSYLRGPLARDQIKLLMDPRREEFAAAPREATNDAGGVPPGHPPVLPPDILQHFLPANVPAMEGEQLHMTPLVAASGSVHVSDRKLGVDATLDITTHTSIPHEAATQILWDEARTFSKPPALETRPPASAYFGELPPPASKPANYTGWGRDFVAWLHRTQKVQLFYSPSAEVHSRPGESERDFRIRLAQEGRETRDRKLEALRAEYADRVAAIEKKRAAAEARLENERQQARDNTFQSALNIGLAVLSGLFSRKKLSATNMNRAATAARRISRTMKESDDVARAEADFEQIQAELTALQEELTAAVDRFQKTTDPLTETFEPMALHPTKSACKLVQISLVWMPRWRDGQGLFRDAWQSN